ncbi:hypothetical protein E4T43_06058 [Aureobasidium subglaciale]|nr:hypothetical protein E4T43_06058 [Aureobasidium subglaciale]
MPKEVKQKSGLSRGLNAGHVLTAPAAAAAVDDANFANDTTTSTRIFCTDNYDSTDISWIQSNRHNRNPQTTTTSHHRLTHTPPHRQPIKQFLQDQSTNKVTPRQPAPRVSRTKGHLSKRTAFVRDVVKEVAGLAPYERRVVELLRNSKDKRARKLAKRRLGTFGRAKRKVDEMTNYIAESRRAGH